MRVSGAEFLPRLILLAWVGLTCFSARAVPFVPNSDDVVLERLPDAGDSVARALRAQHRALAADPGNLGLALSVVTGTLGGLYPAWRAARMVPMDAIRVGSH